MLIAAFAIALIAASLAPQQAWAQGKRSKVDLITKKAQDLFDKQEYELSIQTASAAAVRPDVTKAQKILALRLLAYNYIVLNKKGSAEGAIRGILVVDEKFVLPDTESPRFRAVFEEAAKKWVADGKPGRSKAKPGKAAVMVNPVKIKHASPAQADKGKAIRLSGTIDDPKAMVSKLVLFYRKSGEKKFNKKPIKFAMRKFSVDLPQRAVRPPLVEYYIAALDSNGLPVSSRGDVELPLRIAVPQGRGVLQSPWFWVPVSVAVVATVVIVAVVATRPSDSKVTVNVFE